MLKTKLGELKLPNPTVLASGVLGNSAGLLKRIAENGAGALTTKSISLKPQNGYENPTVVELEYGLLNAIGLSNPGIEEFKKELTGLNLDIPVIGSCWGESIEEFPTIAAKLSKYVDAIEINLSCPHTQLRLIGQNPKVVKRVTRDVRSVINKPLIVKLTPNVNSISTVASSAVDGGADIISAINSVGAMAINIETKTPVLGNAVGGYSGPAVKPIAIRCVYEISNEIDVPIIGIGGIITGRDAIEMLMAGASAIGIGTGVLYRNINIFEKICNEIKEFMIKEDYKKIDELVGCAVRN